MKLKIIYMFPVIQVITLCDLQPDKLEFISFEKVKSKNAKINTAEAKVRPRDTFLPGKCKVDYLILTWRCSAPSE